MDTEPHPVAGQIADHAETSREHVVFNGRPNIASGPAGRCGGDTHRERLFSNLEEALRGGTRPGHRHRQSGIGDEAIMNEP